MANSNVLILSEEDDGTTDAVISWIKFLGGEFLRLNNTSEISFRKLDLSNEHDDIELEYNNTVFKLSEFDAYWYRRGRLNIKYPKTSTPLSTSKIDLAIQETLTNEYDFLTRYVYDYFEKKNKRSIGSIYDNRTNKISNLIVARKVGLRVPPTVVVTSKEQIAQFIELHGKILIKPIYQRGFFYEDHTLITSGLSALVEMDDIASFPSKFPPSLLQGYVDKDIELRVFFLNGVCYTSAIFSQMDQKTKVDFRNYNWQKPNRTPPYLLPKKISKKISKFMAKVNMNSGSLDIILTPDGEYVFLEVNPIGQFWQVSYPCNYNLEKKIAEFLCNT